MIHYYVTDIFWIETLLTYATTLAFYLHLQSAPSEADPSTPSSSSVPTLAEAKRLKAEVIARLLTLKQALSTLEDLGFAADEVEEEEPSDEDDIGLDGETPYWIGSGESDESESEVSDDDVSPYGLKPGEQVPYANGGTPRLENLEEPWQKDKVAGWVDPSGSSGGDKGKKKKKSGPKLGKLEEGELEALMQDALDLKGPSPPPSPPKKKNKTDTSESSGKDKKKKKKSADPPAPVFDLVEPKFATMKSKGKGKQTSTDNADVDSEALGDPTQLSHTDASDKAGRRKSLRFHTSRIER